MRLTGYEIKKLMTQIPLWIAFIGLFVGNLFLLFMIQKKEAAYVYVYQQKDQYIAFCEGNEQADELGFYEADLEEQKRYLDSYREFISQMQDRSKAMENVISEGNHYLTDNIRKTCHDFSAVAKASVTVDNCFGIKALAEYQYGIFFAISFQGVLTWYLLFYERNRKLFILIKGCKNGHHVTAYSKLFLLLSGGGTVYLVTGNQCCFVPEMDVWIWQYEQTRTVGFSFPQLPVCIKRRAGHRTAYFSSCGTVPADRVCSFYGGHAGEIGNWSFHCHDASYDMRICSVPFHCCHGNPAGM